MNRALRYGLITAGVFAALALLVVFFPWNLLRGPVASYASQYLQRPVAIDGTFDVDLGSPMRVSATDITIGNAAWSKHQPMARAERMVLTFTLSGLLRGVPERVDLIAPDVLLERNADGAANWEFDDSGTTTIPEFGRLDVERGALRYLDPRMRADIRLSVQTMPGTGDSPAELRVDGKGTMRGEAVQLDGRGHGVAALRKVDDPYKLAINARAGRTSVRFDGTIVPADPENVRGNLRIQGPDLSRLYPIVPSPLPWTPPYNLSGELAHSKDLWTLRRIKGTVGDSDLAGDFQLDTSKPRTKTIADLSSSRFHYKDLGGFIGLPPGNAATAEQQNEAARREASSRVLPEKEFDLAKLRELDAEVKFRGTAVKFGAIPIDNLSSRIRLANGVMRLEPLDFGIADGHIVSNVTLDVTRPTAAISGEIEARRLELKRIFPKLASPEGTAGRFGGRATFKAQGNSVAAMSASLDADAAVIMRGGEASTLTLVLTNLDLANAAQLLLRGDETARIRCAVAAFHAKDGVVTPDLLVVDTSAVVITGDGTIDLRRETLDLRLTSKSKQPSLLALRGPIVLDGTLKSPNARPSLAQAAARVGVAAGLGAIAPPLALLPLIDFGGAADVDCRSLLQDARVETGTTERIPRPNAKSRPAPRGNEGARPSGSPPAAPAKAEQPASKDAG